MTEKDYGGLLIITATPKKGFAFFNQLKLVVDSKGYIQSSEYQNKLPLSNNIMNLVGYKALGYLESDEDGQYVNPILSNPNSGPLVVTSPLFTDEDSNLELMVVNTTNNKRFEVEDVNNVKNMLTPPAECDQDYCKEDLDENQARYSDIPWTTFLDGQQNLALKLPLWVKKVHLLNKMFL